MLALLPNKLLTYLFDFLDLHDYNPTILTCKRFSEIFKEHTKFWLRECFSRHISFELDLYSEIYQHEAFKMYIKNKINSFQKKSWRQHLAEGERQKARFSDLLSQISSQQEADAFVNYLCQTLREPNLPVNNLKRENIVYNTQTVYQNKLSEVLYEDTFFVSKGFNSHDENKNLIDQLRKHEGKFFQEALMNDKKDLVKARWYIFETNNNLLDETISFEENTDEIDLDSPCLPSLKRLSNASTEDLATAKCGHSYLINLYDCLQNTLTHFCGIVLEYLLCLDNVYDLLGEYSARWRQYVCSMLELEKTFETFTQLINENYEKIFEGYPSFPKFSVWRLMTKIWINEVYEKMGLDKSLNASFLQVLDNYRAKNILKMDCTKNNCNLDLENSQNGGLPQHLYVCLQTKEKKSDNTDNHFLLETNSNCFNDEQIEKELLSEFIQSILDLSLTEVTIHYLDSSELPVSYPYKELENALLKNTDRFYKEYQPLFNDFPEHFCEFLKSDFHLISDILIQRTLIQLESIQFEQGMRFVKNTINSHVHNFNPEDLLHCKSQISLLSDQRESLDKVVQITIKQALEDARGKMISQQEDCFCEDGLNSTNSEANMFDRTCETSFDGIEDKDFMHKVTLKIESEYKNIRNDLGYLEERFNSTETTRANDVYVKQRNTDKNIPFEMDDVDCLFYNFDKNVNVALLEKLYEDYILFMKQQSQEEPMSLDEAPDLELNGGEGLNQGVGGLQMDLEDDFDNLDLMNIDTLQLRRAFF